MVRFTVSSQLKNEEDNLEWYFMRVHEPNRQNEREEFWERLWAIKGLWVTRDFHVTRFQDEHNTGIGLSSTMRRFSEVTEDLELRDLPLDGGMGFSHGQQDEV